MHSAPRSAAFEFEFAQELSPSCSGYDGLAFSPYPTRRAEGVVRMQRKVCEFNYPESVLLNLVCVCVGVVNGAVFPQTLNACKPDLLLAVGEVWRM